MSTGSVLICVSGSVAAIKIPELTDKLSNAGYDIRVVLTESATHFVHPNQFRVPVYRDSNEWTTWSRRGDPVLHIELSDWADLLLLAPLSANTMAKLAAGVADNLITTIARAWWFSDSNAPSVTNKPVLFAPAMNTRMWRHPFTMEQIGRLTGKLGWSCIPPISKVLVCGYEGIGAMAEIGNILDAVKQHSNTNRSTVSEV